MTCFSLCEKQQCSRETLTASLRHQQSTDGAAAAAALMAPTSEAKGWILGVPRQGWEMSADSATKEPSFPFWREERSFRFINSRLKRNYLPTDPNHQHKETRTKSSFFFQSLKDLKKKKERNVAGLLSALLMSQSNIAKGIMEAHFQKLRRMKEFKLWSPDTPPMNLLPGRPEADILPVMYMYRYLKVQHKDQLFAFHTNGVAIFGKTARLALRLQPPVKINASLEILPVQGGKPQRPTTVEPTPGWRCRYWPGNSKCP